MNILNVVLSASGTPSEVKARIADQVQATADASEQAAVMSAARVFIDKTLSNVSEDDTVSVKGTISITVLPVPPIVTSRQEAEREKHSADMRVANAEVDRLKHELEASKAALALAISPKSDTPAAPVAG